MKKLYTLEFVQPMEAPAVIDAPPDATDEEVIQALRCCNWQPDLEDAGDRLLEGCVDESEAWDDEAEADIRLVYDENGTLVLQPVERASPRPPSLDDLDVKAIQTACANLGLKEVAHA